MAYVWNNSVVEQVQLASLFEWLDRLPLSKVRTNVEKDFADGLLTAEVVKLYFPEMVDIREFREVHDVKERQAQWNFLNSKVLKIIGLNIPKHVITQLSIAKTGVAPILLYNLRACITLFGANTNIIPPLHLPVLVRPPVYEDPLWAKYNLRLNLLGEGPKFIHPNEYEYLWNKKQIERAIKSDRGKQLPLISPTESGSSSSRLAITKKLTKNPYLISPAISDLSLTAAKLELDDKTKQISAKDDELLMLKEKLKRMEVLLNTKNAKIQELTTRVEKLQPVKKK
ncbi:unnamed protein product [Brachionus calyciflorus]|uniref:CH-like domain-containing protein n=1 Tax=Brachionus calyciflorus TaxID=104777 RepID=A0A813MTV1_9BILA|nr:unnamed protein product [Brachionus calyciflorus]